MDPGNVVWFEISTADAEAVKAFYGDLLGWSFAAAPDSSVGGATYTRVMAPGIPDVTVFARLTDPRGNRFGLGAMPVQNA
ncbi:hypothetical protein SMC26_13400 [Actinomadura fulvescens]|uniref:Glyoxalase/Bleomycin resistance-like N-terminal domain-containing protein n=1 Tax=Actinomadura fulvescens TaxID=46160 RepID=A0ABN3PIU0_9ACTN